MDFRDEVRDLKTRVEAAEAAQVAATNKAVHLHSVCQSLLRRMRRLELTLPDVSRWAQNTRLVIPARPINLDAILNI